MKLLILFAFVIASVLSSLDNARSCHIGNRSLPLQKNIGFDQSNEKYKIMSRGLNKDFSGKYVVLLDCGVLKLR